MYDGAEWTFSDDHVQQAFENIKRLIAASTALAHVDPRLPTPLRRDAGGSRIVLRTILQLKAIQTEQFTRVCENESIPTKKSKVLWFPGIDSLVKRHFGNCAACQIVTDTSRP